MGDQPDKCTACGHRRGTPHATNCVYAAFEHRPPTPPPPPSSNGNGSNGHHHRGGALSPYAAAALRGEVAAVAGTPEGGRNVRLNEAAIKLGSLVGAGLLDQGTVSVELTQAARTAGLPDGEIARTLRSGLTAGIAQPRTLPETAAYDSSLPDFEPTGVDGVDDDRDEFWTARPCLDHVRTYARARRTSPWAVLGVALARVVTATPPFVVLPALVGSHASLNLFVGLVGPSGAGKGAADSAAADAIDVGHVETIGVGSGEGIGHIYARRAKDGSVDMHTTAALLSIPEIDTLTALGGRQGTTLLPELRKAWSGERLGFAYADATKRLPIPAHSYRLAIVAGIQPARGRALLDDRDAGTPQRWLWLPAIDRHAPDTPPPCPDTMHWSYPTWPMAEYQTGRSIVPVCDTAQHVIDVQRLARLRGDGDALDGHSLLARLKVAAALALLDRRVGVTEEDWELAGAVMAVSDATREWVRRAVAAEAADRNRKAGVAEAERRVVVEERVEDAAVKRVCNVVLRRLRRADESPWVPRGELTRAVASRDRLHLPEALERLLEAGQIEVEDTEQSSQYRISEKT